MMRLVRRITRLALPAIAVVALTAQSAVADHGGDLQHNQTPRVLAAQEVHAAADTVCPAVTPSPPPVVWPTVTNGGCRQHYSSPNVTLSAHLSAGGTEVVVSVCALEFNVRMDASGEGWMSHQEFTAGPVGTCTKKACGQTIAPTGEGGAFPFFLHETEPAPRESLTFNICTQNLDDTGWSYCVFTLTMSQPTLHRYRFTAIDLPGHGSAFPHCELDGTFDVEAGLGTSTESQALQHVEVRHT